MSIQQDAATAKYLHDFLKIVQGIAVEWLKVNNETVWPLDCMELAVKWSGELSLSLDEKVEKY